MEDARALLNSLMGGDRDAHPEQRKERKYTDDDICKNYLLGLCPNELFTSTKIDLGRCEKHHSDEFKETFEVDLEGARYRRKWRAILRPQLRRLLDNVDRRIGLNSIRVAKEKGSTTDLTEDQKQQVDKLKEEVAEKLRLAEQAGDDGKFEESRELVKGSEDIKRRMEDVEYKRFEKYKKENICDICGLIIDDKEAEDMKTGRGWHSNGKQHIGYAIIREKLAELDLEIRKDERNGVKSVSASPVKDKCKDDDKGRKGSKSRSPAKRQKGEDVKRKKSPSKKRSDDNGKRKLSPSKNSTRKKTHEDTTRKSNRSKSRAKTPKQDEKKSKASKSRSRSRKKRGRSRKRSKSKKSRSRSRDKTKGKHAVSKRTSPKRRSSSSDSDKKRKARKASEAKKKKKSAKKKKSTSSSSSS